MSIHCPHCKQQNPSSESRSIIVATGSFRRKSDQSLQRRFHCKPCKKSFSTASHELCYWQKKRHLNPEIFKHYVSCASQRRLALLLKTNRKTIVRKFIFLGLLAKVVNEFDRKAYEKVSEFQFDDLETFEHSKLKPLSVVAAVESKTRRILGFKVARMPAKGLLVQRSLKKYGPRRDERKKKRRELFSEIKEFVHDQCIIKSDENPHYGPCVREFFPGAVHKTYKGRRGCVVGQGELKAGGYDPIFSLNHTYAMARANINRLFRRTWNTTKKPERLALHMELYVLFHNRVLI